MGRKIVADGASGCVKEREKQNLPFSAGPIYAVAEKELLSPVPAGSIRIPASAGLATIKERFMARIHGN